jgi:hypothetical protein
LLATLRTYNKPHSLDGPPLKTVAFKNAIQHLTITIEQQARATAAARMSAGARFVEQVDSMLEYLAAVHKMVSRLVEQVDRQIALYSTDSAAIALEEQTRALYDETIELLCAPASVAQEVQP